MSAVLVIRPAFLQPFRAEWLLGMEEIQIERVNGKDFLLGSGGFSHVYRGTKDGVQVRAGCPGQFFTCSCACVIAIYTVRQPALIIATPLSESAWTVCREGDAHV